MAASVIDLLTDKTLLKKAKEEWMERMKGRVYSSPLPPELEPPLEEAMLQAEISMRGRR
jgi:hypothetical protein